MNYYITEPRGFLNLKFWIEQRKQFLFRKRIRNVTEDLLFQRNSNMVVSRACERLKKKWNEEPLLGGGP
jgi:hypothetical protein